MCTRQSRKVIWDMISTLFLTTVPVEPTLVAFLQHSQTHFRGLSHQFFQISLKNSELKTTHNAFRDCRVHFFRQPFSKQLYMEFSKSIQSMKKHYFYSHQKSTKLVYEICLIPIVLWGKLKNKFMIFALHRISSNNQKTG